MPIFYSRLLPSATLKNADDPLTREGYLRAALTKATKGGAREAIAGEMVRSNLDGQWPALSATFYSESESGYLSSDARLGILRALGEAPHSRNKLVVLVGLINDPRSEMPDAGQPPLSLSGRGNIVSECHRRKKIRFPHPASGFGKTRAIGECTCRIAPAREPLLRR
jgi:hypothetical protein